MEVKSLTILELVGLVTKTIIAIGSDRLYDWNLEGGMKFVWR